MLSAQALFFGVTHCVKGIAQKLMRDKGHNERYVGLPKKAGTRAQQILGLENELELDLTIQEALSSAKLNLIQ